MSEPGEFKYDVFLSHSAKDKSIVRPLAERLRTDGLNVWFDEWEIKPGDSIPSKIEEGLENSRVLVLCMSAHAFGSDWAQLESGTFRFRDPLNKSRRFIPLRLDETPIKGSLAQFLCIDWPRTSEDSYRKILNACKPMKKVPISLINVRLTTIKTSVRRLGVNHRYEIELEAINESDWQLGWSGLTINVPPVKSLEIFNSLVIHTESHSPRRVAVYPPNTMVFGFFDNQNNSTAVGVAGKFGKSPAKNLMIESEYETWDAQASISLCAVLQGPVPSLGSKLDLHLRVWANLPPECGASKVVGDPGWNLPCAKDQQGIPAYLQSIGF